jgi:hypothetical protein
MDRRARRALERQPTDTDEHLAVLGAARRTNAALRRTERVLANLQTQRANVFAAGRELTPPITYSRFGDALGITEGAVMQAAAKVHRLNGHAVE